MASIFYTIHHFNASSYTSGCQNRKCSRWTKNLFYTQKKEVKIQWSNWNTLYIYIYICKASVYLSEFAFKSCFCKMFYKKPKFYWFHWSYSKVKRHFKNHLYILKNPLQQLMQIPHNYDFTTLIYLNNEGTKLMSLQIFSFSEN